MGGWEGLWVVLPFAAGGQEAARHAPNGSLDHGVLLHHQRRTHGAEHVEALVNAAKTGTDGVEGTMSIEDSRAWQCYFAREPKGKQRDSIWW